MRPIVLFLTVWLPASAGAMELGGIPTPATRMQRGVTCAFAPGVAPRCSDGRPIATNRSTPATCYASDGTRVDVGVNQGCVTDFGLATYGQNTTYLANGDNLGASSWNLSGSGTRIAISGGWRISGNVTGYINQSFAGLAGETYTTTCRLRSVTSSTARMFSASAVAGGVAQTCNVTSQWSECSVTTVLSQSGSAGAWIYPSATATTESVDVQGCWTARSSASGRPCYGTNASGTTCDGERHTISTAGFPTTRGWIRMSVERADQAAAASQLIDSRGAGGDTVALVTGSNILQVASGGVTTNHGSVGAAPWKASLDLRLRPDGVDVYVDGVARNPRAGALGSWGTSAVLGVSYVGVAPLNGSFKSLSWSPR